MAFKLTKSNISQIRLWLFLRKRTRAGAEGAGKNEVKCRNEKVEVKNPMRERERELRDGRRVRQSKADEDKKTLF